MMRRFALVALLVGCGGTSSTKEAATTDAPSTDATDAPGHTLPGVSDDPIGSIPEPEPTAAHTRQKKRMTVSQVRDSMERITGGIVWGDGEDSDWDTFAGTLGVADYQTRTSSDRTPSVLFQRFLDDAAAHTCAEWVAAPDTTFFEVDDPTSTEQADVRANIAGLRWQIQGRPRSEEVPVIDDYVDLFAMVYRRTGATTDAWHTVCVAMFTHPDFFMY